MKRTHKDCGGLVITIREWWPAWLLCVSMAICWKCGAGPVMDSDIE